MAMRLRLCLLGGVSETAAEGRSGLSGSMDGCVESQAVHG
jgi:hypothetical protein